MFIFIVVLITLSFIPDADCSLGRYSPEEIDCPPSNIPLVRPANDLDPNEVQFIANRNKVIRPYLRDFIQRSQVDFNTDIILEANITIGHAFSGGGYRAMLVGAGIMAAIDNRSHGSTKLGHFGGLLQASSYISALSGGGWLLGSMYFNNFATIEDLLNKKHIWNFQTSILNRELKLELLIKDYGRMIGDLQDKMNAGYPISITDLWGRLLDAQMIDDVSNGRTLQWSDLEKQSWFQSFSCPFPILTANSRMPLASKIRSKSAANFEITPFELGSWDPAIYAFTSLKYLGTELVNGQPRKLCKTGLDNVGFILGTSSSIFDAALHSIIDSMPILPRTSLGCALKQVIGTTTLDLAVIKPNPFYGYKSPYPLKDDTITTADSLYLVDGGEGYQNIPLQPLIHRDRKVDILFAYDIGDDTEYHWPNGTSLKFTYESLANIQQDFNSLDTLPPIPDTLTFMKYELTKRPIFFGCYPPQKAYGSPLIVYMPNNRYSTWSNTSTFKLTYSRAESLDLINNGYNLMTQMNGTLDTSWQKCISCAIVLKEFQRRAISLSPECQKCMRKYCWDGKKSIV